MPPQRTLTDAGGPAVPLDTVQSDAVEPLANAPAGMALPCDSACRAHPAPTQSFRLIDEVQDARLRLAKLINRIKRHRAALLDRTQALQIRATRTILPARQQRWRVH